MVNVNLNLLNIFALQLNKNVIQYEGNTVGEIITKFIREYKNSLDPRLLSSNQKKLNEHILILVNGQNIESLKRYKTKLKEGDNIYLSIALSGG